MRLDNVIKTDECIEPKQYKRIEKEDQEKDGEKKRCMDNLSSETWRLGLHFPVP